MAPPTTTRKLIVTKYSPKFREATKLVSAPLPDAAALPADNLIVKNCFAGVNASDINWTNGKYPPRLDVPYDCGFEAVGQVVAAGSGVKDFKVGDTVAYTGMGCYSEHSVVSVRQAMPLPKGVSPSATLLPLLVSGLTASVALEHVAQMKSKAQSGDGKFKPEKVLVTAAAGGTGQFAVQLAKLAGNHVIGTCSDDSKTALLKSLGCDRVINYKKEDLFQVLRAEYPEGVDVVYESVGGSTYEACLSNLAVGGRLVVIGMVSSYQDEGAFGGPKGGESKPASQSSGSSTVAMKLLGKTASVRGFFLMHFQRELRRHFQQLVQLMQEGKLRSVVDAHPFNGLEQVADAIDFLYTGKNLGKVVINLAGMPASKL